MSGPTARFSDRVAHYVRHRPSYPPAVLEVLREETGLAAADAGVGEGDLRAPLPGPRERRPRRRAEPGDARRGHGPMMAALERLFAEHEEDGEVAFVYETEIYFGRV